MADWRERLSSFLTTSDRRRRQEEENSEWAQFLAQVVTPAFEELAAELEKHGRTAAIRNSVVTAQLLVMNGGEEEMLYRIQAKPMPDRILPQAEIRSRERKGLKYFTTEAMLRSATPAYRLADITREDIIQNFLQHYMRRVENA
jgi:choline/glycine/proline betaine transport protein